MIIKSSENGLGDGAFSFWSAGLGAQDKAGHLHFVETDVQTYGASHKEVIVLTHDSTISTVGLALVDEVFIETTLVALGV